MHTSEKKHQNQHLQQRRDSSSGKEELDKENKQMRSNLWGERKYATSSLDKHKKYDYLNKYNQHQMLEKAYQHQYDEIKDNHFHRDILIVEKRSNSSSNNSPPFRRTSSPSPRRESPKKILMRKYEGTGSSGGRSQNKKYVSFKEDGSRPLVASNSNSPAPKYKSVISNIPSFGQGLSAEVAHQN